MSQKDRQPPDPTRKPALTPEQEAAGWRVENAGGMWVKTCNVNELKPLPSARDELTKLRASLDDLIGRWEHWAVISRSWPDPELAEYHQGRAVALETCVVELRAAAKGAP